VEGVRGEYGRRTMDGETYTMREKFAKGEPRSMGGLRSG